MKHLTKKEVISFNNDIISYCESKGLSIVRNDETHIELSATKNGVIVRVMLVKFDNEYRTKTNTLHCMMYPTDKNNSEATDKCNDAMLYLKGESHNYKYNAYPENTFLALEHLKPLFYQFSKM